MKSFALGFAVIMTLGLTLRAHADEAKQTYARFDQKTWSSCYVNSVKKIASYWGAPIELKSKLKEARSYPSKHRYIQVDPLMKDGLLTPDFMNDVLQGYYQAYGLELVPGIDFEHEKGVILFKSLLTPANYEGSFVKYSAESGIGDVKTPITIEFKAVLVSEKQLTDGSPDLGVCKAGGCPHRSILRCAPYAINITSSNGKSWSVPLEDFVARAEGWNPFAAKKLPNNLETLFDPAAGEVIR
jgi:hypothetical protein